MPLSFRNPPVTFFPLLSLCPNAASAFFAGEKGMCSFLFIIDSKLKALCFQLYQLGANHLMSQTPSSVMPSAPVWKARMAALVLHPCGGAGNVGKSPKISKVSPSLSATSPADWLQPSRSLSLSTHLHVVLLASLGHFHRKVHDQDEAGSPCQDDVAILLGENSHAGAVRERELVTTSGCDWRSVSSTHAGMYVDDLLNMDPRPPSTETG